MYSLFLCSEVQSVCIFNASFKEKSLKYFQFCASTINMIEKSKRVPRSPSSPTMQQWTGALGSLSKKLLRCSEKAEKSRKTRKEINSTTNYTRRHLDRIRRLIILFVTQGRFHLPGFSQVENSSFTATDFIDTSLRFSFF
jgi:hypothetical protein